jgi:siroheme synthase
MARMPTLVVMMATKRLDETCRALIEAGKDPDTPAVAISWGTTDCQEVARATLGTLCEVVEGCQLATPALVVMGEVAALAGDLSWFRPDGRAAGFVPLPESTPVHQGE